MDNIGSDVSQKMRSAVKAKLIELGTGGSSGYIDDELPDYVMIMVANKRSKQQMKTDLNLFLGSQTDLFVTWLYEVLQKLQEVTLPVTSKRKGDKDDTASKRDRKEKKRERRSKKSPDIEVGITSITDVITGQFIEKAKQDLIDVNNLVKTKKEIIKPDETLDQFDIPTIAEMNATISVAIPRRSREEDLAELAAIQKQIYETKRQLKTLNSSDESEDDDFLNIKEEAEEFDEDIEKKNQVKKKSPIVFNNIENCQEETNSSAILMDIDVQMDLIVDTPPPTIFSLSNTPENIKPIQEEHSKQFVDMEIDCDEVKQTSVHDRLGIKAVKSSDSIVNLAAHRRVEKEIYIPAFRRKAMEEQKIRDAERRHELSKGNVSRIRDKNSHGKPSDLVNKFRNRVGSRVIVAPVKPKLRREKEHIERPVNSVIKIKPRPLVSPSKQACKNLLLRAVAEAQKSTILAKPRALSPSIDRSQRLFTKSFRNRATRDSLVRRVKQGNLFIEVKSDKQIGLCNANNDEEYIPQLVSEPSESDNDLVYVPKSVTIQNIEEFNNQYLQETEDAYEIPNQIENSTQFVVTLDETAGEKFKSRLISQDKFRKGYNGKKELRLSKNQTSSQPSSQPSSSIKSRLQLKRNLLSDDRRQPPNTPSPQPYKKTGLIEIYRKPKEIKKIIIQNDSEDDNFIKQKNILDRKITDSHLSRSRSNSIDYRSTTPPLPPREREVVVNKVKLPAKRKLSPIKFDLNERSFEPKQRSKSGERDESIKSLNISSTSINDSDVANSSENEGSKASKKKLEVKKYDNIPELLSSVSIDSTLKIKSKERCKYYPSCTKGDLCEFFHPTSPCKAFPNCKFSDKCLYVHPKCKFDLTCTKNACNFSHSVSLTNQSTAPPISSHVVPSQNFKLLMASAVTTPAMCKYYPNCSNNHCSFFHPKLCRFGKNCINKNECNFYHQETPSKDKFKWVASIV